MKTLLENPVLVQLLLSLITAAVGFAVAWFNAQKKQLEIAATAGMRIADAHAAPKLDVDGAERKMIADGAAAELLAKPVPPEKIAVAVQAAWKKDRDTRRASLPPADPLADTDPPDA